MAAKKGGWPWFWGFVVMAGVGVLCAGCERAPAAGAGVPCIGAGWCSDPHDPEAFTQGLVFDSSILYKGTRLLIVQPTGVGLGRVQC